MALRSALLLRGSSFVLVVGMTERGGTVPASCILSYHTAWNTESRVRTTVTVNPKGNHTKKWNSTSGMEVQARYVLYHAWCTVLPTAVLLSSAPWWWWWWELSSAITWLLSVAANFFLYTQRVVHTAVCRAQQSMLHVQYSTQCCTHYSAVYSTVQSTVQYHLSTQKSVQQYTAAAVQSMNLLCVQYQVHSTVCVSTLSHT